MYRSCIFLSSFNCACRPHGLFTTYSIAIQLGAVVLKRYLLHISYYEYRSRCDGHIDIYILSQSVLVVWTWRPQDKSKSIVIWWYTSIHWHLRKNKLWKIMIMSPDLRLIKRNTRKTSPPRARVSVCRADRATHHWVRLFYYVLWI